MVPGLRLTTVDFEAPEEALDAQQRKRAVLANVAPRFYMNSTRLLQFGTARPVPEGAPVVYFADAFDALSGLTRQLAHSDVGEVQVCGERVLDLRRLLGRSERGARVTPDREGALRRQLPADVYVRAGAQLAGDAGRGRHCLRRALRSDKGNH